MTAPYQPGRLVVDTSYAGSAFLLAATGPKIEINGQPVSAGDKVGLFYCSANRDEAVFDEPGRFNLQRSPNPHLGFGGGGPHFCLGNQLTKAELRNLFRELLTRLKTVEFGEPDLLYSSFVHGVKRLPAFVK